MAALLTYHLAGIPLMGGPPPLQHPSVSHACASLPQHGKSVLRTTRSIVALLVPQRTVTLRRYHNSPSIPGNKPPRERTPPVDEGSLPSPASKPNKKRVIVGISSMCMQTATAKTMERVLIWGGKTGWIGQQMAELAKEGGMKVFLAESRMEDRSAVEAELDEVKPDHVFLASGITGRPNIDWCEDHKEDTIRTNVIGTLNVADLCCTKNIHCTVFATGCIFQYDEAHPLGSGIGFTEEEMPNFSESFYSETKGYMEQMLKCYPTCLILRVRMPISDDLFHRNFVTKIVKYEKVVNVPNSMTVLHEMLPASLAMSKAGLTGVYNFTNPGVISHNEVLDLYRKYIDPTYTYKNFTLEEQAKVIKAGRSNNELDTTKLMRDMPEGVVINDIKTACDLCFQRMRVNLEKMGWLPDNLPEEFRRS